MALDYIAALADTAAVRCGIVHLGLGAFMRAHLAVYTEQAMQQDVAGHAWGICAVNVRSNADIVTTLQAQQQRYHVAEYRNSVDVTLREIASVKEALFAGDAAHGAALLARLRDPAIRIVSLTVTEKGYCLNPANGALLDNDERLRHDIANPAAPVTPIGILLAALVQRKQDGVAPFTVLSCDNMPSNGKAVKSALLQLAARVQPALQQWIEQEVRCPSTMVDRIVPAMTAGKFDEVNALLQRLKPGCNTDHAAVACEQFSQWVIEDDFPQGRPAWELGGAEFVSDVEPFEAMKLRMLNGSHSLLAYLGNLGQLEHVAYCMEQEAYVALIRHYMLQEAKPTLHVPASVDLAAYADSLLARYRNDSLRHRTAQIAMDGSMKLPQRWLAGLQVLLQQGQLPQVTALGIAAWFRYLGGIDEQGKAYKVDDPQASDMQAVIAAHADPAARVRALLATRVFAGTQLGEHTALVQQITAFYRLLLQQGARATVAATVQRLQ